ncbi:MoaB/Mog domain-containing protein [Earliella scabrosa]|nr:MoaB/Mog domain-containing protein [Earliella scabrosa]
MHHRALARPPVSLPRALPIARSPRNQGLLVRANARATASRSFYHHHLRSSDPPLILARTPPKPSFQRTHSRYTMSTAAKNVSADPSAPDKNTDTPAAKPVGQELPQLNFPVSPVPPNPLGEGRYIKTAAALVIGDEILNGKTLDRNSNYFARLCFENGIELKRIEVVPDEEDDMCVHIMCIHACVQRILTCMLSVEAARRLVKNYDFVITTGGIGPTHDDITYASLAKAFDQPLEHHTETLRRINELIKYRSDMANQTAEQRAARERMALFPARAEVLYIASDVWVPVVRLEGKLCVFPGIPKLFQQMLNGLLPYLPLPPPSERPFRQQVFTQIPESSIAPYLTELQARTKEAGVRVGSYPLLSKGVYVSLIGRDVEKVREIAEEVAERLQGRLVTEEEARKEKAAL